MRKQRIRTDRGGKEQNCGARKATLSKRDRAEVQNMVEGSVSYHRRYNKWMYVCACVAEQPEREDKNRRSENKRLETFGE